jgi:hypothetical protein
LHSKPVSSGYWLKDTSTRNLRSPYSFEGATIRLLAPRQALCIDTDRPWPSSPPLSSPRHAVMVAVGMDTTDFVADRSSPSTASSTALANPPTTRFVRRAPFNVAFGIIVRANGSSNVIIDGVQFRFTDSSGLQTPQITLPMPPVTIAAPVPTTQFGSALVQAGSATTVPLFLAIGCGTGRQGTIVIIVDTSDEIGHHSSHHVKVAVR